VIPPTDEYPDRIEAAVKAILGSGISAGRAKLEPIAFQAQDLPRRKAPTPGVYAEVYRRDRFACRYCGGRVIPTPIMRVLATLYPDIFPYHPNWKVDRTHPAFLSRSPSLDHLTSGAHGGGWLDIDNLVTACWLCNIRKSDLTLEQLGWKLRPVPEVGWDGLTGPYRALWLVAGQPDSER
jgi:5-methylcytosine-specific restriction endonuclease McrA